ncbi:carbamoyl phosphate synthase-like protein [Candidatus Nanopelagicaceae bacterium]
MRVYISSVGGDIAQSIAGIITRVFDSVFIVGTDLNAENSGKALVNLFEISPSAEDDGYLPWLSNFLKLHSIEYFIPVNEKELHALASIPSHQLSEALGSCSLIWAGRDPVQIFEDKMATSAFLQNIGVRTPAHFLEPASLNSSDFPVIVKPNLGAGSRNLFVCRTRLELDAALRFVSNPIIQRYVGDAENEFTAAIFRNTKGDTRVINFRRKLSAGATGWAQVFPHLEIENLCKKIASSIDLNGSINIQFRLDQGHPSVFEINGRFSSTVYMRHLLGFEDLLWSLGRDESFAKFDQSLIAGAEALKLINFEIWPVT